MSRRQALQCSARVKRTGQQCQRFSVIGGTVCPMHGGSSPQVRAKAAQRAVEAKAARTVERWGVPRDVDPLGALGELLAGSAGLIDFYGAMVETERREGRLSPDNPWLRAFDSERDRLGRLSSSSAGLGLQAISTVSGSASRIIQVVRSVLGSVGVAFDDRARTALKTALADAAMSPDPAVEAALMTPEQRAERARALAEELRLKSGLPSAEQRAEVTARIERQLRRRIEKLEAEVERLSGRVQADGMSTRLALPAADPEPDVFDVDEPIVLDPEPPDPEPLEPDEILPPAAEASSRPRRGQSVLEHFAGARRSAGYRS